MAACRFGDWRDSDSCLLSWEGGRPPTGHPWARGEQTGSQREAATPGAPSSELPAISRFQMAGCIRVRPQSLLRLQAVDTQDIPPTHRVLVVCFRSSVVVFMLVVQLLGTELQFLWRQGYSVDIV